MLPELETERTRLRQVPKEHYQTYFEHFNNWNVVRFLSARVTWPTSIEAITDFLDGAKKGRNEYLWGIYLKENLDEPIGNIHITKEKNEGIRGFWLAEKHWKKGIMTEVVSKVNDFMFFEVGLEKMTFGNSPENTGSRRIKEKTGAKFLRTEPFEYLDMSLTISEQWELTREDWERFISTH